MNFQNRGDNNNVSPRLGLRVGCHRRRENGRARRIRPALQHDHERHARRRGNDAAADEHQHQQPVVSRSLPGTLAGVVRLDRAAEHQHRLRRHGEPVRGHDQRRVLAAARRRHGDQRGRRQHEVERVQRRRGTSTRRGHTGVRAASRLWGNITQVQSIGWQKYRALLVRLEKRLSSRHQYTAVVHAAEGHGQLVRRHLDGHDH